MIDNLAVAAVGTGATARAAATDTSNRKSFASGDFQTFLTMLTAQIKNQDPMSPMDNAEFAVQLATFSGVEQQVRTNQLLEGLGGGGGGGLAQYADWIGKEARSTAPVTFTDRAITLDIAPEAGADKVILITRNSKGQIVGSESIGTGSGQVDWYGRDQTGAKLPDGRYSLTLESWKAGAKLSSKPVESYAPVIEVERGADGVTLITTGGTRLSSSDVTALRSAP